MSALRGQLGGSSQRGHILDREAGRFSGAARPAPMVGNGQDAAVWTAYWVSFSMVMLLAMVRNAVWIASPLATK